MSTTAPTSEPYTTEAIASSSPPATIPHLRLPKSAHDKVLTATPVTSRASCLALLLAFLRIENDAHRARGEAFPAKSSDLARFSGLSARSVFRFSKLLVGLGVIEMVSSGQRQNRENTYRVLEVEAPPPSRFASRPASFSDVEAFAVRENLNIPHATLKAYWDFNQARDWMIPDDTTRVPKPCRDWQKMLPGFAVTHRPNIEPALAPPSPTSTPAPTRRPRSASTPIPEMPDEIQRRALAICEVLGRSPDSPWCAKEMDAFTNAGLDTMPTDSFDEQLANINWYYYRCAKGWVYDQSSNSVDYRRSTLGSFLNHWPDEVGKSMRERAAIQRLAEQNQLARG